MDLSEETLEPTKPAVFEKMPPSPSANRGLILHDVPFVAQAPTGKWDDPRQQDGCEEAASFMAMLWVRGEKPPQKAMDVERELLAISSWEEEQFGDYRDTSASDTVERIFNGYFKYDKVKVVYDIAAEDIIGELESGNLVIVPADGRKLGNPYFTPPGPERHMFVIRGYDPKTDEFITNDNGTRRGEGYRYKASILISAVRDYPTGDRLPIAETKKAMIVVSKE